MVGGRYFVHLVEFIVSDGATMIALIEFNISISFLYITYFSLHKHIKSAFTPDHKIPGVIPFPVEKKFD